MASELTYYIDRLSEGRSEVIDCTLSPDFLEVDDSLLSFSNDVVLRGEAYLANDHLIIQVNIDTSYSTPCKICGEPNNAKSLFNKRDKRH